MVKTCSQLADEAAPEPSNNDDRQSSDDKDLQNKEQFDPSRTKLYFCDCMAEEKEDPNSTHYSHAVHVKKPVDPPSCKISPTPSLQPKQEDQSKVPEVVKLARKCPGEFAELPKADTEEGKEEEQPK